MIADELKQLVDEKIVEAIKNNLVETTKVLEQLKNEIKDLKVEIEILKEGGNL